MLSAIICADWSKDQAKRDAYVADVREGVVRRLKGEPYTLRSLLTSAQRYSESGSVLLGIDAPLGAPRSLLAATCARLAVPPSSTFLEWLVHAAPEPHFFDPPGSPDEWSPVRPFFSVPAGPDGLGRWMRVMRDRGVEPYRSVDVATGAKALFILSGIPGSVGSSVRDVWTSLAAILAERRDGFGVWPFDRPDPAAAAGVVLAEIYPRSLYAAALLSEPPASRPRLAVAKTDPECRRAAIESLLAQEWVRTAGVRIHDVDAAAKSEDACDALLSAAGALRCARDGTPLGWTGADAFEGGIVGLEGVNLTLRERPFHRRVPVRRTGSTNIAPKEATTTVDTSRDRSPFLQRAATDWIASNPLAFAIPDGFPVSPGHTLVVTRRLVPTWFEATGAERRAILDLVDEVKQTLDRRTPRPDGYNVGFNAGAAAGQTVMHLHVHVIPRYSGDVPDPRGGIRHVIPGRGNYLE